MDRNLSKCIKCGVDKVDADDCPSCGVIYATAERDFFENLREKIRNEEVERPIKSEHADSVKTTNDNNKNEDEEAYFLKLRAKHKKQRRILMIVLGCTLVWGGWSFLNDMIYEMKGGVSKESNKKLEKIKAARKNEKEEKYTSHTMPNYDVCLDALDRIVKEEKIGFDRNGRNANRSLGDCWWDKKTGKAFCNDSAGLMIHFHCSSSGILYEYYEVFKQ